MADWVTTPAMDYNGTWLVLAAAAGWLLKGLADFFLKEWLATHKDRLKRAANAKFAMLLFDLVVLAGLVYLAFSVFNNDKPAVRQDILVGLGFLAFFILVVVNTADDLVQWARTVWGPRASQAKPAPTSLASAPGREPNP